MSVNELPLETTDINNIVSIGDPIYRMSPILPSDRFGWLEGQEFDVVVFPALAKVYPNGVLPDPRYRYFKVVDKTTDQSGVLIEQSVQPLTFIGDVMSPHTHEYTLAGVSNKDSTKNTSAPDPNVLIHSPRSMPTTGASAGTPTGTIGGTSILTQPNSITAYCMCRIK